MPAVTRLVRAQIVVGPVHISTGSTATASTTVALYGNKSNQALRVVSDAEHHCPPMSEGDISNEFKQRTFLKSFDRGQTTWMRRSVSYLRTDTSGASSTASKT